MRRGAIALPPSTAAASVPLARAPAEGVTAAREHGDAPHPVAASPGGALASHALREPLPDQAVAIEDGGNPDAQLGRRPPAVEQSGSGLVADFTVPGGVLAFAEDRPQEPWRPPEPPVAAVSPSAGESPENGDGFVAARAIRLVKPRYPELSRRKGQEGSVVLSAEIQPDGNPRNIQVVESSGYRRLDQAAAQALRNSSFAPARWGGQPVQAHKQIRFTFELKAPPR
ncbi:MAG: energy transducer TonB [SAR324 cluster bacterium]|nr:energy transducer TonB [SAR324 cluster bacterium]